MALRATARHPKDDAKVAERHVLAIEPDAFQARILEEKLVGRGGITFRLLTSTESAVATFSESVPDLILVSPLLSSQHEEQIVSRLFALGVDASHVQLLSIPRFAGAPATAGRKGPLGVLRRRSSASKTAGCDPDAFAEEIAEHLARTSPARQGWRDDQADDEDLDTPPFAPALDDPLRSVSAEHIENLLERLDAEVPVERSEPAVEYSEPSVEYSEPSELATATATAEIILFEPVPKFEPVPEQEIEMPTTTATRNDPGADTAIDSGASGMPRFLTPDDRIPLPLRALLHEAEGCLKMAFLTGAGACAARTLELLLAEQGIDDPDRSEQIQQLGKKHPAVAESFIGALSLVTNNASGTWEDARAKLAIALLKAIAHEIYVLGPERTERAAYVLDLLKKFKAAGRA